MPCPYFRKALPQLPAARKPATFPQVFNSGGPKGELEAPQAGGSSLAAVGNLW